MHKNNLILDTHTWLWFETGNKEKFSSAILSKIENGLENGQVSVCAISMWEISMLASKKRINLHTPTLQWLKKSLETKGLSLIPLTPEITTESADLPDFFHGDPADRIIIASARLTNSILISQDQEILAYGKKGYLKTLPLHP